MMKLMGKLVSSLLICGVYLQAIELDSIGINFGSAHLNTKEKNVLGSQTLANNPDEWYKNREGYLLFGDVFVDKTIKPSLHVVINRNEEFKNDVFMVGINKYFDNEGYTLYSGVLFGYGKLTWKYNPLNTTIVEDYKAGSLIAAIQFGGEVKLSESIFVGVNTKFYMYNYHTSITTDTQSLIKINHNKSYSASLGLRVSF